MPEAQYIDDRGLIEDAEVVRIDWPANVAKPRVGIVRDLEKFPRWTKYRRFLETNGFAYDSFDIHSHDWIDRARSFDLVIGLVSNEISYLEEIRVKYHFLENYLGKACYPSAEQTLLYDNKCLEAYISDACDLPFAKTHISHSHEDALALVEGLRYPLVSKVNHSSGSMGVELVRTPQKARRIVRKAFSRNGRSIYVPWLRQKNYVYFQEFIPNDGYDIRVIVVGNRAFGYYRKVLGGDFGRRGWTRSKSGRSPRRPSGSPGGPCNASAAPRSWSTWSTAWTAAMRSSNSPSSARSETPEQLLVDGVPGVYIIEDDGDIRFEKGHYWVHELALREFLLDDYLPRASGAPAKAPALCRP